METKESPSTQNDETNESMLNDIQFLERCHAREYDSYKCLCCEIPVQTAQAEMSPAQPGYEAKLKQAGSRLVSILVIGSCLLILAAVVLPCFIGAREMKQRSAVRGNMRTVQLAAESYATDHNGRYPEKLSQIEPFLPAGGFFKDNLVQGSTLKSEDMLTELRNRTISDSGLKPGQVAYCAVAGGNTYAILGSGPDGMQIAGVGGKVLVLSNQ